MFGDDRESMRRFYVEAWRKLRAGEAMEPMERVVAEVIQEHPEYQPLLQGNSESAITRDYQPEDGQTNPFLHMGMHIALREQEATDRPPGVAVLIQRLKSRLGDHLEAEHRLMEPLGEALWEAHRRGGQPDEQAYLERIRRAVRDAGA